MSRTLLLAVLLGLGTQHARGAIIATTYAYASAIGSKTDQDYVLGLGTFVHSDASASFVNSGFNIQSSATAFIDTLEHRRDALFMGLSVVAAETHEWTQYGRFGGEAYAQWSDVVRVNDPSVQFLDFGFGIHGSTSAATYGGPNSDYASFATLLIRFATPNRVDQYISVPSTYNQNATVDTHVLYRVPVINGYANWTVRVSGSAYVNQGTASSNFASTFYFDQVLLADGTTPESHGIAVTFDSGLSSPNLLDWSDPLVTPEPTSLALAGFAGLGMAVGAWRRRRTSKQSAV